MLPGEHTDTGPGALSLDRPSGSLSGEMGAHGSSASLPVILCGMTHRVGRKGQVVIPKAFREAVNLEPGDEVTFSRDGNAIRVERLASPDALMGRLAGHRLVKALEEDRRAERRR